MALYIAQGIAAAHGGTVRMFVDVHGRDGGVDHVHSTLGSSALGSSTCHFVVHLPLLALQESRPELSPRPLRKGSTLLFNSQKYRESTVDRIHVTLQPTMAAQDTGVTTPAVKPGAVVDRWADARPSTNVGTPAVGPQSSLLNGLDPPSTCAPPGVDTITPVEPFLEVSPTKLSAPPPHPPPQPSVKLLVVDDSDLTRKMLCRMVRAKGFQVDEAEDGAVAVDKVRHGPQMYSAILMDFVMPVMDGPTATKHIREQLAYTAPILGVTGNGQDFDVAHFKTCGATGTSDSPFTNDLHRLFTLHLPTEVFTKPLDVPRFLAVLGSHGVVVSPSVKDK